MKLVITGGHHSSALPIINKLRKSHKDVEIHWIGHKYSLKGNNAPTLEFIDINQLGIPFYNLQAGKVYKTYNIFRLLKVPFGFIQSLYLLLTIRPDIILSFGGYLAVPVVIVGKFLGIKSLTHEQTIVTGYANAVIAKYVNKVLISWPDSAKYFPQEKVVYTGIPLRDEIFKVKSKNIKINEDLPTVYITGGKTGAHAINAVISEILGDLLDVCNVIHQCGDHSELKDYDLLQNKYKKFGDKPGKYFLKKYVMNEEIGEVFSKSDLLIARSGAHTVSEVIALEKPAIFIPISWVSHNEQLKNAEMVKNYGLAELIEEKDLQPQHLLNKIKDVLSHIKSYKLNNRKIKEELLKDSTSLIVNEIFNLYKTKTTN